MLLLFVTGMTRKPVGGFQCLTSIGGDRMPFTILRVPYNIDSDSCDLPLPTASTCFNLLKIPEYPTEDILINKVLIAIRFGSLGFTVS